MMGDDELMTAIADGIGASTVPPGLVRRKRAKKSKRPKRKLGLGFG